MPKHVIFTVKLVKVRYTLSISEEVPNKKNIVRPWNLFENLWWTAISFFYFRAILKRVTTPTHPTHNCQHLPIPIYPEYTFIHHHPTTSTQNIPPFTRHLPMINVYPPSTHPKYTFNQPLHTWEMSNHPNPPKIYLRPPLLTQKNVQPLPST